MNPDAPALRLARDSDVEAITVVMRASVLELFPALLDPRSDVARIRAMFVRPDWTRRGLGRAILQAGHDAARAEGFTRLDLGATLPGVALYKAFGFRELESIVVTMPDGVTLDAIAMERPVDPIYVRYGKHRGQPP
ncbi:MAG: GNAT family N-acetyltransferase [Acidimicrobiales bacterium]